jgi:hypothetical protein
MWEKSLSSRCLTSVLGFCLAVAGTPAIAAEYPFDGVFSGQRVLTKGSASDGCLAKGDVSVTIQGETLTFTNSALDKFTLAFHPGKDGSFGETYTDESGTTVYYRGRIVGGVMEADVNHPPCAYHWHLKRQ